MAQTLVIEESQSRVNFEIPILDDTTYEGDETFLVTMSNFVEVMPGSVTETTVTINEDEIPPAEGELGFVIVDFEVNEVEDSYTIDVERMNGSVGEVSVRVSTADNGGTAGDDYVALDQTLIFADGEILKQVSVEIIDDDIFEGDEGFELVLSNAQGGATIGSANDVVITIKENDPAPTAGSLQWSGDTYSFSEDSGFAIATINRVNGTLGIVTVDVDSTDITAMTIEDHAGAATTISFADGETSKEVSIELIDDNEYEGDETFSLLMSNATGDASIVNPAQTIVTIVENDAIPVSGNFQFSGSSYSVNENVGSIIVTVNRVNGSFGEVTLEINSFDNTATANVDYISINQTLTFLDGETSKVVTVTILDDQNYEGNETLILELSNASGDSVIVAPSSAELTIVEDDSQPLTGDFSFDANEYTVTESGSLEFSINRINGSYGEISVDLQTIAGSATSEIDYFAINQTVTLYDGEVARRVTFTTVEDDEIEGDETLSFQLQNPSLGSSIVGDNPVAVTILDHSSTTEIGVIEWNQTSVSLNEASGIIEMALLRRQGSFGECRATVSISHSTTDDDDFTQMSTKELVFLDGETNRDYSFTIFNDDEIEDVETFFLQISNVENCALGSRSEMTATITDDDEEPAGEINLSQTLLTVDESQGTFSITLLRQLGNFGECQVTANVNHNSTDSNDLTGNLSQTIIFADGETSKTSSFTISEDTEDENDETFTIQLANAQNCTLGNNSSMTVTIRDNDTSVDGSGGGTTNEPEESSSGGGSFGYPLALLLIFVLYRIRRYQFFALMNVKPNKYL